ncbi:hypothetical protein DYI37_19380 [Fulvimarina endophytica]|uniref:FAD-dependent urate hydroxylase HpyO/Asp monooxygenase CreE-like FAD/NAD(P)-binding domain-containing protein n=1 Tax=Fulvimarina endophytica TaxID=2293836 RepID=A0A371WYF6_9HYPH|nr:FAD/NAD(P)-binding protein [Fulvimarina endophytica]RFC61794.1 hypothetical protein DYI37_19380 [Fulvimarina endophytica]
MSPRRILVIGGGASGVILAAHLLREGDPDLKLAFIERDTTIGAGVAYGTHERDHLLNTRVGSMSAFADDPDHFWHWLTASGRAEDVGCSTPFCFVQRRVYREYLASVVSQWTEGIGDGRLKVITSECVDLAAFDGGVSATLADGHSVIADLAVLTTGHAVPRTEPGSLYSSPWLSREELAIEPEASVAIVGTGLSMIDNVALLRTQGHRGSIIAISRRGLLPRVHKQARPFKLDAADVPFGTSLTFLLRWLRRTIRWVEAEGGDWRDVVDALRPHTQGLWQALPESAKRRFLRHGRTIWEVHRHRVAPQADRSLRQALDEGQLTILPGRIGDVVLEDGRIAISLRRRGGEPARLTVDHLIDCTGILREPTSGETRLVERMIARGAARMDSLGFGIDVDRECALIGKDGMVSRRLYAAGPVTRARFSEVTAIPDIRTQCAALAKTLIARTSSLV